MAAKREALEPMGTYTFTTDDGRELRAIKLLGSHLDPTFLEARCEIYLDGETVLSYEEVPRLNQAIAVPEKLFGPGGHQVHLSSWAPTIAVGLTITVEFSAYAPPEDTTNDEELKSRRAR